MQVGFLYVSHGLKLNNKQTVSIPGEENDRTQATMGEPGLHDVFFGTEWVENLMSHTCVQTLRLSVSISISE